MSVSMPLCEEEVGLVQPETKTKDRTEKPVREAPVRELSIFQNPELLDRLAKLAECIRIDPHSGDLILERGGARLALQEDGVVRIQARRIVEVADQDITLYGAYIDLN